MKAAIVATGKVLHELVGPSHLDVTENTIATLGDGITIATDNARVAQNDVGVLSTEVLGLGGKPLAFVGAMMKATQRRAGNGIVVAANALEAGIDRCLIVGN